MLAARRGFNVNPRLDDGERRRGYLTAFRMIFLFAGFLLSACAAQCPDSVDTVEPCLCTVDGQQKTVMSCGRELTLPRLTTVLRRGMCGHHLDRFEMREANVTYLPSNLFYKTPVKEISISHMSITRFTEAGTSAFQGLEDVLESLSMRHCALVDGLQWQMIGRMRTLTQLDLSYNNLTRIPSEWFQMPPSNLRSLVLRRNRISALEPGAMTFMHKLVQLDLSENRISSLSRNALPRPGNALIFLSLSYNQLDSLPEDLFDEMMSIRRIYLDNNLIKVLGKEETWSPVWGDLDVLDLNGNPLECSCEALWISELRPPRLLYGECEAPADLQGVFLKSLETDHFEFCQATPTE